VDPIKLGAFLVYPSPMRQQAVRLLKLGGVATVPVAAWWYVRLAGWISGPDEYLGDAAISLLPLLLLWLGWLLLGAARNVERAACTPQRLRVRARPREGGPERTGHDATVWVAVGSAFLVLLFVLAVSVYPRTWNEAWECVPVGDGTDCRVVGGAWYHQVLLVAAIFAGLGSIPLAIMVVPELRRLRDTPPPVVDLSDVSLTPGEKLDVVALVFGKRALDALRLSVHCLEEAKYDVGSGWNSESRRVYDAVLEERHGVANWGPVPLELAHSWTVPREAMHSFASANNEIRWYVSLYLRIGKHELNPMYDITMLASRDANGKGTAP
jgi:hypothetical protein